MDLDVEGIANAAGFGYAQANGNRQALLEGTLAKRLTPAFSARAGVHAALLAEMGATGPRSILEGEDGIIALFGGGEGDPSTLTNGLGERFEVNQIGMKPYPCCRGAHPNISAALEAKARLGTFGPEEIEAVDVWITVNNHLQVGHPFRIRENPQVDAQFSAQWTTATALLYGEPRLEDFKPETVLGRRDVEELAYKVKLHTWKNGTPPQVPSRVLVRLKDGRSADVTHD